MGTGRRHLSLRLRAFALAFTLLTLTGCSPAAMQALSEGMADLGGTMAAMQSSNTKLMVFGGPGHDTYLGCLNCSEYASDSVLNQQGTYGNPYSSTSVFNSYSQFGSPYSAYSACNPLATDPPVVVDGSGNFYGHLTLNQTHHQAIRSGEIIGWLQRSVCR